MKNFHITLNYDGKRSYKIVAAQSVRVAVSEATASAAKDYQVSINEIEVTNVSEFENENHISSQRL